MYPLHVAGTWDAAEVVYNPLVFGLSSGQPVKRGESRDAFEVGRPQSSFRMRTPPKKPQPPDYNNFKPVLTGVENSDVLAEKLVLKPSSDLV